MATTQNKRWIAVATIVTAAIVSSLFAVRNYCAEEQLFAKEVPVRVGMSRTEIITRVGDPERIIEIDGVEVWYYGQERAYVSFRNGKSIASNIAYRQPPWWLR